VLDPERKKMSKSVGNVVTPLPLLELHGADSLRYWSACGRPGVDTALDEGQMKIGRRLAIKILNASKFVLGRLDGASLPGPIDITEPIDRDLLAMLAQLIGDATRAYDGYDYARALEHTESFFWSFCDNYLELVKIRAYGDDADAQTRSARATLSITLSVLQRLLAPTLPFVTEEVWRWWHEQSVHLAPWPSVDELALNEAATNPGSIYGPICDVLEAIRREKSTAKVSQRAEVALCTVAGPSELLDAVRAAQNDLAKAGGVLEWQLEEASDASITVTLA
jgi:valyl-tRNA synthetase